MKRNVNTVNNRIVSTYFLLTLLFFYTQLHIAINFAWFHAVSLENLVLSLVFLKLGEFSHEIFDGGSVAIWLGGSISSALLIGYQSGLYPLYFLFGLSTMKVRSMIASFSLKQVKIVARAVGFIASPFFSLYVYVIIVALCAIIASSTQRLRFKLKPRLYSLTQKENSHVYATMAVHHAQYFSYAYSIPILFSIVGNLPYWAMGLMFFVGWAAYNVYEPFIKPRWTWFFAGHIAAAVSLWFLYSSSLLANMTFWWFMTGLGGGTVYMLGTFLVSKNRLASRELTMAEGTGHVLGILTWATVLYNFQMRDTFLSGVTLALLGALMTLPVISKRRGSI